MGSRLFDYHYESSVPNYILEHAEREVVEREVIQRFVKDLPLSALKQVFNLETINEAHCLQKIEKSTKQRRSSILERRV